MKRREATIPAPGPVRVLVFASFVFAASLFAGCDMGLFEDSETPGPATLSNPPIDSLSIWPPAMRYARPGDTVFIRMRGLRLGYTCATLTELRWNWRDSIGHDDYTLLSEVDVPGGPDCEPGGAFDSTFRVIFHTHAGDKLYIRHGENAKRDSLLYLSGFGYVETFVHRDADPDSAVIERGDYRFTYHDSTRERPRRFITATLPICETFQSSVFKREGDSVTVRLRRIVAKPLPSEAFPPCAGAHADTMEVVPDLYDTF